MLDAAFDYNSPTCSKDIKEYTNDSLKYAFDCMSEGSSTEITVSSISSEGGVYTTLLPVPVQEVKKFNSKVENKSTLGYTVLGEAIRKGPTDIPAVPENFEFGKVFWELSTGLLESGKVKPHRPSVNKYGKGLEGVLEGMEAMRAGKVSGEKLVYTL